MQRFKTLSPKIIPFLVALYPLRCSTPGKESLVLVILNTGNLGPSMPHSNSFTGMESVLGDTMWTLWEHLEGNI